MNVQHLRQRHNDEERSIDSLLLHQVGNETDGLNGLPQPHLIGQDSVELLGVHDAQPVEADQLVGLQLKPVTHSHPHVTPPWHKA